MAISGTLGRAGEISNLERHLLFKDLQCSPGPQSGSVPSSLVGHCPGLSHPHQPGQAPQPLEHSLPCSARIWVSPLIPPVSPRFVRIPLCSRGPVRRILPLHLPQPQAPLAGPWVLAPPSCPQGAPCGLDLGLIHTPRSQPHTRAMGQPHTGLSVQEVSGRQCPQGGQLGGTSGVRLLSLKMGPFQAGATV